MALIIKNTAVSTDKAIASSVQHAVVAGRLCLERAGITPKDIDLLINVGVYRDDNMLEPAMAALIQKGIGIKGDYVKGQLETAAFSVDLLNGSCGLLNGLQVADSMLKTKNYKYALIVSGDAHPSNKETADFPYSCVGAAMLVEYNQNDQLGFSQFSFNTSATPEHSPESYIDFTTNDQPARERLTLTVPQTYEKELFEFTKSTLGDYLGSLAIDRSTLKLVTSQVHEGFGLQLADALGLKNDQIIDAYKDFGDAHTSALSLAYHLASEKQFYKPGDTLLFAAAGAGLSTAFAVYSI